jgi:hypothetical protein
MEDIPSMSSSHEPGAYIKEMVESVVGYKTRDLSTLGINEQVSFERCIDRRKWRNN